MKEAVMVGIRTSILRRQNTVAQYIATQPILDLCEQATRRPGARVSWRWWEQTGIDLERAQKQADVSAAEAETESEEESDRAVGGGGEEDSQRASGSSGAEWSVAEGDWAYTFDGPGITEGTT